MVVPKRYEPKQDKRCTLTRNTVAHTRKHSCNGNTTMPSLCIQLHVTVNNIKIMFCTTILLCLIFVAGNNKTYVCLHVDCHVFWSDCNRLWIFSTDFHKSSQYQISRKSVQWDPLIHAARQTDRQTNGHDEANRRFSRLCERA